MPTARSLLHPNTWMPAAHTTQRGARTQTPGGGTRDTEPAGGPCFAFQVRRGACRLLRPFCPCSPLVPLHVSPEIQLPRITPQTAQRRVRKGLPLGARQNRGQFLILTLLNILTLGKFCYLHPIHKKEVEKTTPWIRAAASLPEVPSLIFSTQVAADNYL